MADIPPLDFWSTLFTAHAAAERGRTARYAVVPSDGPAPTIMFKAARDSTPSVEKKE